MVPRKGKWIVAMPTAVLLSGIPFCSAQTLGGAAPVGLPRPNLVGAGQSSADRDSPPGKGPGLICRRVPGGGQKQALFTEADAKRMIIRTALFTEADARRMVTRNAAWTSESRKGPVIQGYRPPDARAHR